MNKPVKLEKRTRIIDAAIDVFARQGYYNAKVAMIAKEAGVADGTIYLYFKSKEDILISIFEEKFDQVIALQKENLERFKTAREQLRSFARIHLKLVEDNASLAELLQVELRQSAKFMKDYHNDLFLEYLNLIGNIVANGRNEGLFRADIKITVVKIIFFGAIDEFSTQWLLNRPRNLTIEQAADQICTIFLQGINNNK